MLCVSVKGHGVATGHGIARSGTFDQGPDDEKEQVDQTFKGEIMSCAPVCSRIFPRPERGVPRGLGNAFALEKLVDLKINLITYTLMEKRTNTLT